jgi:hypothetical protein
MIGEIALGIKLTNDAITLGKSAVEGCAKIINNCKDPSEVSGHLDQLFKAQYAVQQQQNKHKHNKEWNNYLTQKLDDAGEFEGESISDITAEIIHQKQIDTWDEIIELRKTRRKENKVKRAKAKEAFLERQAITRKRTLYWLQQAGNTIILGLCVAGLWWGLAYLVECAGKCF